MKTLGIEQATLDPVFANSKGTRAGHPWRASGRHGGCLGGLDEDHCTRRQRPVLAADHGASLSSPP